MYARPRCPWLLVTALLLSGRSLALKMYLYDLPSSLVKPPCEVMHNYHLEEALPRFLAMPSSPTRTSDASNADFFVVPATPYCRQTEADMEVRVTLSPPPSVFTLARYRLPCTRRTQNPDSYVWSLDSS